MTINLELPPDVEARFLAEAQHKGVPVAEVIQAHLVRSRAPAAEPSAMTPEQRAKALDELFDNMAVPAGIQEAAFHRENWYR
jgi:hypothetical protein